MPSRGNNVQPLVFACMFIAGWAFIANTNIETQLHEEGHIASAKGIGLQAKQIAPNMVEVSGNAHPSDWRRLYMAGYWQVAVTTGALLWVGWVIACFTASYWWLGILAGIHHYAWYAPVGSSDFARLSAPDWNGWWLVAIACLFVFWAALVLQRKFRGS